VETGVLSGIGSAPIVTAKGVYFLAPGAIQLFDSTTGNVSAVATLENMSMRGWSVSPDGAYIIWSQMDKNTTDLMLIEGFR